MRRRPWYLIGIVLLLAGAEASAQVPQLITYQGRLTETNGIPFTGTHTMVFRVYDAETGGSKLWEESHTVTLAKEDNGIFSVVLGSLNALSNLDFNQSLWLALAVDGEGEMSPRQRLTAVGYAINADTLDGLDSAQFVRKDTTATTTSGELTLDRSGRALLIKPSKDPDANTTVMEIQNAAGTSRFSVDGEGDVVVAGSLTVSGTLSGSSVTSGTVTSVDSGAGLTGGPITNSGTLAVNLQSGAGIVADGTGLSLLRTCSNGQLLKWNTTSSAWECQSDTDTDTNSGGTVTSITAGTGLSGGTIIGSGTISLNIPVSITNGGTGASTASEARANLINCLPIGGASSSSHNSMFQMGVGGESATNDRLDRVWPVPTAGKMTSLSAYVNQAPGSGDSWTVTLRKNASNTSLSCTISGSSTQSCSAIGTVTVSAGDRLGVEFTEGGSAASTTGSGWSACFIPD